MEGARKRSLLTIPLRDSLKKNYGQKDKKLYQHIDRRFVQALGFPSYSLLENFHQQPKAVEDEKNSNWNTTEDKPTNKLQETQKKTTYCFTFFNQNFPPFYLFFLWYCLQNKSIGSPVGPVCLSRFWKNTTRQGEE